MTMKLFIGAITKFLLGVVLVGLLIFLPAGTLCFFNGWLLMGILFVPMFLAGVVMMFKNPELLKKRRYDSYIDYGKRFESLLKECQAKAAL